MRLSSTQNPELYPVSSRHATVPHIAISLTLYETTHLVLFAISFEDVLRFLHCFRIDVVEVKRERRVSVGTVLVSHLYPANNLVVTSFVIVMAEKKKQEPDTKEQEPDRNKARAKFYEKHVQRLGLRPNEDRIGLQ